MRVAFTVLFIILAVLLAVAVGFYTYFNRPTSCGLCHIMKPYLSSWQKTDHAKKKVDCYECHAIPGIRGRIAANARVLRYTITYLGKKPKLIKGEVSNQACLRCHFSYATESKALVASKHFKSYLKEKISCTDCHLQLAHLSADKKKLPKPLKNNWATVDNCQQCHVPQYDLWKESLHAEAIDALQPQNITNKVCLPCHTLTPKLANVQCENCHGEGGKHIARPKRGNVPVAELKAEVCGSCHSGSHHDTFSDAEWKGTKHAKALEDLKKAKETAKDYCLKCHSVDYRLAAADEKPTLSTAKLPLTCQACHDTHTTDTRLSKEKLCPSCHTGENLAVGWEVHYPTKEFFLGRRVKDSGVSFPPVFGKHVNNGVTCVNCHMYKRVFVSEQEPAKTGHDFLAKPEGCNACHPERGIDGNKTKIDELQAPTRAALVELKPRLDAAKLKLDELKKAGRENKQLRLLYDVAKFDYDFVEQDGSNGFHNPDYAGALLQQTRENLNAFEAQTR